MARRRAVLCLCCPESRPWPDAARSGCTLPIIILFLRLRGRLLALRRSSLPVRSSPLLWSRRDRRWEGPWHLEKNSREPPVGRLSDLFDLSWMLRCSGAADPDGGVRDWGWTFYLSFFSIFRRHIWILQRRSAHGTRSTFTVWSPESSMHCL